MPKKDVVPFEVLLDESGETLEDVDKLASLGFDDFASDTAGMQWSSLGNITKERWYRAVLAILKGYEELQRKQGESL